MWRLVLISVLAVNCVFCNEDYRTVYLEQGGVIGEKYWNGDFYEFFGVPYATVPKGRDRYKGPLPVEPWEGEIPADNRKLICPQSYYTGEEDANIVVSGEEECLIMNILVPEVASEKNLLPVVVYVHSGAFAVGSGGIAKLHYLARHDVIAITFNFRLGAIGFACLGTEDIPGNAGMKDQVAALRWINKNIKYFGGDPDKVTLAGFSVGATMAELLTLSKSTAGLVDKLILESGSAFSPYAINRDPIATATNIAISLGYKDTGNIKDLTEFYLNASADALSAKSRHFFLTNSTFGFAPCIENEYKYIEPFLTKSPSEIVSNHEHNKVTVLTGFANMEGISRALKFDTWSEMMNEKFADFLPADLKFDSDEARDKVIKDIKEFYFNGEEVSHDTLQGYVDYFSDSMFKYAILGSAQIHAGISKKPVYFYEFSYVGELSMKHNYMDKLNGASHRDQSSYVLDFLGYTMNYDDLNTRDRMTLMWTDFIKYGNPTAYESILVDFEWPEYTQQGPYYLSINKTIELKKGLVNKNFEFWHNIYNKYYWVPTAPVPPPPKPIEEVKESKKEIKVEKPVGEKEKKEAKETPQVKETTEAKPEVKEIPQKEKETSQKVKETPPVVKETSQKIKESVPESKDSVSKAKAAEKETKKPDSEPTKVVDLKYPSDNVKQAEDVKEEPAKDKKPVKKNKPVADKVRVADIPRK